MPRTKTPSNGADAPRIPHLHRDRHGTYYFRLTLGGQTVKRSLRTKNPVSATMAAARLNWEWETMTEPKEPSVSEVVEAFKKKGRKFDSRP